MLEGQRGDPVAAQRAEVEAVMAFVAVCPEAPHWPAGAWEELVREQDDNLAAHRRVFLTRSDQGTILGLTAVTLVDDKTELEVLLVHPAARRQGIGRKLAAHWLTWANAAGACEAVLEVRASNLGARQLYDSLGFREQGYRPGYYQHPREDALLMGRTLGAKESGEGMDHFQPSKNATV